ncbi:uncharacterized protein EAF02_004979 [Botrytis sinoallii]|uniref:uncharacterized protein n=1 Tax=Botrytis sinoallii TaxID=1463999 RepID=UPI001900E231|nr:uncharacterized protein EAF02_004979 [Botrytis sinoallii]KAF7884643.1 hypothetical protein EAF02_004979 [Botrytis sinoallii]
MFDDTKPPNHTIPTTDEWSAALLKLCQRVSKVIIVIDALDECVDFSKLLTVLKKLQVKQLDDIKFVFSSRLNVDVDKVFTASEGVILTTEDTLKDMSQYIENEVKSKEEDIDSNDEETKRRLMDRIVRVLSDFAGGMFKWVTLQLAIMFPIETQTFLPENIEIRLLDIENRNSSLEQSLNSAYEMVYLMNAKPGAYNTSVFKSVCKWLLCCKTALPAEEVLKVIELSLDHDSKLKGITRSPLSTKVVLHCCSNFVIQNSDGNFRFAHLSVEEYLINHCAVKFEFQYEECHLFVMKICLDFMAQERTDSVAKLGRKQYYLGAVMSDSVESFGEIFTFQTYSISYWAYHAKKSTPEKRCRESLYKRFALGDRLSASLKWWFAQIDARNYYSSESILSRIKETADVLLGLPRSDQYPSKSRVRMLGAAFNLPEILENGINNHKEEVDMPLRTDHGANPTRISVAHRQWTKYDIMVRPVRDMVYWVTREGGNNQEQLEGHLQVENVLLNHEKSRRHFLNQLERHLRIDTHPDPSRALKILYRASNEVPISAKIFEYRIETRGLGELGEVLDLIDDETFDEEMVAEVVRRDSCETVKNVFGFKEVSSITEKIVRNALESFDSKTLAYLMKQFGHDALTREIVINTKLRSHEVWKVILDVKGIQFINQEVLGSLFDNWGEGPESVTLVLDSCGIDMVGSSHIETIAGSSFYALEALNAILRIRGSLDGLITEEAVFKAFRQESFDMAAVLLENAEDLPSLLTKQVKEVAKQGGDAGMLVLEKFVNNTRD